MNNYKNKLKRESGLSLSFYPPGMYISWPKNNAEKEKIEKRNKKGGFVAWPKEKSVNCFNWN